MARNAHSASSIAPLAAAIRKWIAAGRVVKFGIITAKSNDGDSVVTYWLLALRRRRATVFRRARVTLGLVVLLSFEDRGGVPPSLGLGWGSWGTNRS